MTTKYWKSALMVILAFVLTACTSQSRKTASNLDMKHPRYSSRECQVALGNAQLQDTIKQARVLTSPVLILMSGGLFVPLLAVNAGLDAVDHLEASDISRHCGGSEIPNRDIAIEIIKGVGFGIGVSK